MLLPASLQDWLPKGHLKAITEARERLEQRQRDADIERGRSQDDECKPRDKNGNPKGGRYKREFGVPKPKAQDNFTDPASRQRAMRPPSLPPLTRGDHTAP